MEEHESPKPREGFPLTTLECILILTLLSALLFGAGGGLGYLLGTQRSIDESRFVNICESALKMNAGHIVTLQDERDFYEARLVNYEQFLTEKGLNPSLTITQLPKLDALVKSKLGQGGP